MISLLHSKFLAAGITTLLQCITDDCFVLAEARRVQVDTFDDGSAVSLQLHQHPAVNELLISALSSFKVMGQLAKTTTIRSHRLAGLALGV